MDRTSRKRNRTAGKWIVHEVNGSYSMEIDRTSSKLMDHTSREMDRTYKKLGCTGNVSYLKGNGS